MPVRKSGLPFSTGIDIARISRFIHYFDHALGLNSMQTNKLLHFFDRIFTAPEQQLFWHRYQGLEGLRKNAHARLVAAQYLASRWAAKEAIIKAWKTRRLHMLDIEVHARERQAPLAIVLDAPRSQLPADRQKKPEERQAQRVLREWMESNRTKQQPHTGSVEKPHTQTETEDQLRTFRALASVTDDDSQCFEGLRRSKLSQPGPASHETRGSDEDVEEGHKQPEPGDRNELSQSELGLHRATRPDQGDLDRTMPVPEDTNGEEVSISISHDGDYCIAMAIVPVSHEGAFSR